MKLVIRTSPLAPIVVLIPCLVLGLDPLYLVLRAPADFPKINLGLFLFRLVFSCFFVNEFIKALIAMFVVAFMVVWSTIGFIRRITPRTKARGMLNMRMIQVYRELQIWNGFTNEIFCYFAVPPLIFFGIAFIILTWYGSIAMAGKISWLVYPVIPGSCGSAVFFLVTLVPNAAKVYEDSNSYLTQLSKNLSDKYDRLVAKSLRPLGIQVGPFGWVEKGLLLAELKCCSENTGSLLITF